MSVSRMQMRSDIKVPGTKKAEKMIAVL